ncbi:MAG: precorrin-3B synthase, partial [Rhizobiaceae bacterium]|nr:precorrin-3B synthase [Rhizobiaceae bacterium]
LSADIRLKAVSADSGAITWTVAIGGTASTAQPLASLSADQSISIVIDLLKALAQRGPRTRGRDLDAAELRAEFDLPRGIARRAISPHITPLGIHHLGKTENVLSLRPSFGQMQAQDIIRLLDIAEAAGATEIRTAPDHVLLVLGLPEEKARNVQLAAANCGFQTEADDPANHIAVCAGAGACASAFYSTKTTAADLIRLAPDVLDGSLTVHLSGCRKGCAHPAGAPLVLVGAPMGYGIVVNGSASATPVAYIGKEEIKSALARLADLVRNNKVAGESARECLTRLGTDAIVAAMRQG